MDLRRVRWDSSSRVTFPISLRSHSIIPQGSECTTLRRECSATFMRTGLMAHVWIGQIGFARTHCFHPFFQHNQQALYHNSTLQHQHGLFSTQPLLMDSRHSFYRPSMTFHKQHKTLETVGQQLTNHRDLLLSTHQRNWNPRRISSDLALSKRMQKCAMALMSGLFLGSVPVRLSAITRK